MYGSALSPRADRPPPQPATTTHTAAPLYQQPPLTSSGAGGAASPVTDGVGGDHPVRFLLCIGPPAQVHPPSGLAHGLRPQVQSQTQWHTPRPARPRLTAPAVYTGDGHRCGRQEDHLLGARPPRALGRPGLRCPRFRLETAPPGQSPGVLRQYGSRPARQQGLAGLWPAVVVRNRQFVPQRAVGLSRFPGAPVRRRGQMVCRGAPGLGLRRVALRPRTLIPGPAPGRYHPTASRRAYARLVDRRVADGARNRFHRTGAPALLARSLSRGLARHPMPSPRVLNLARSTHGFVLPDCEGYLPYEQHLGPGFSPEYSWNVNARGRGR